jgi:hypothetical protein
MDYFSIGMFIGGIGLGLQIGYFIGRMRTTKMIQHPDEAPKVSTNELTKEYCDSCGEKLTDNGKCYNTDCDNNDLPW